MEVSGEYEATKGTGERHITFWEQPPRLLVPLIYIILCVLGARNRSFFSHAHVASARVNAWNNAKEFISKVNWCKVDELQTVMRCI